MTTVPQVRGKAGMIATWTVFAGILYRILRPKTTRAVVRSRSDTLKAAREANWRAQRRAAQAHATNMERHNAQAT